MAVQPDHRALPALPPLTAADYVLPDSPVLLWRVPPPCLSPKTQPHATKFRRLVEHIIVSNWRAEGLTYTISAFAACGPVADCRTHVRCFFNITVDVGDDYTEADLKKAKADLLVSRPKGIQEILCTRKVLLYPGAQEEPLSPKQLQADYVTHCRHNAAKTGNAAFLLPQCYPRVLM